MFYLNKTEIIYVVKGKSKSIFEWQYFNNRKHNLMIGKDENGLYCSYANLNFNTKFPILLHNDDYLTDLIVEDNFKDVLHNSFKHI